MKKSRRTPRDTETAGGFLKSTLEDPEAEGFVESTTDYAVTGPYTTSDWDGTNAKTITVDLQSYPTTGGAKENAGGSWRAYEAGVVKIDKTTGEPVRYPGLAHRPPLLCILGGEAPRTSVDGKAASLHKRKRHSPCPNQG